VNAEGTLLALADPGNNALLVSASTGETVHTLRGHRAFLRDIRFSPDGSVVGSVSDDGELIVWDTATGRPLERWDTESPWGLGFNPDGDLVYRGGGDSMLRTWDLSVEDTYLQQTTQVGDADVFAHADVSPDGQQVAYSWLDDTGQGWVRFVDTVTGEATPPARVPVSRGPWASGTWHPQGQKYVAHAYCFLTECGARGQAAVVLSPATGRVLEKRELFDGYVSSIAYVDGNRRLLVGDGEGRTHLLDAESLLPEGDGFEFDARFSTTPIGDGSTAMVHEFFADGASGHWRVIHVSTGDVLSEGDLDLVAYASVASPDGSTVAVAGDTGEIVIIDVSTGVEQRRSAGLGAEVLWLDYSEDGELLVSAATDGGVSLWDATTLDLLGTVYPPHQGDPVAAGARFIGDSHDVAIASYDGRVYRWQTDLERAIDFACQMAGRNLTDEEWEEFLPAQPFQSVCPDE
jgi:WD40 repeat protein